MNPPEVLMDYVKHYQSQGFVPIPLYGMRAGICTCRLGAQCTSSGKHPIIKRQTVIAAGDELWSSWIATHPSMNLGILTGSESGIFVLDVDPRHGGDESYEELIQLIGPLPVTLAAQTGGGGRHYVFKIPPGVAIKNSVGTLGEGLDVRGEGGLIVVEPSVTKGEYKWL